MTWHQHYDTVIHEAYAQKMCCSKLMCCRKSRYPQPLQFSWVSTTVYDQLLFKPTTRKHPGELPVFLGSCTSAGRCPSCWGVARLPGEFLASFSFGSNFLGSCPSAVGLSTCVYIYIYIYIYICIVHMCIYTCTYTYMCSMLYHIILY